MFNAMDYPITLVETQSFQREIDRLMSQQERTELFNHLAFHPEAGEIIQGTEGVRKLRWRYGNKGKRGGLRIIYYFRDLNMPLYLLALYTKGQKINLNMRERNQIKALVNVLVSEHGKKITDLVAKQLNGA